jgi:hypothetical protein
VTRQGPKASVLLALSAIRFADGEALLRTERPERYGGAIYIAGYGVECALKARICHDLRQVSLPEKFWRHDLVWLAERTRFRCRVRADRQVSDRLRWLAGEWFVSMRYQRYPYDRARVRVFIQRAREFAQEVVQCP